MKYLLDFIENDAKETKIFTLLEISEDEALILQFLTKNYLEGVAINSVYGILTALFGSEEYEYLNQLESIKNLQDYGYITKNINIFKEEKKSSLLSLLHSEIELSEHFLAILEEGSVRDKFPQITEYKDYLEYLQDQFLLIELYQKRVHSKMDNKIADLKNIIEQRVKISKIEILVEKLFIKHALNEKEKIIFLALLKEEYSGEYESRRDINSLIAMISVDEMDKIKNRALLEEGSNLISSGLIDYDEVFGTLGGISKSFFICEDVLYEIIHPQKVTKKSKKMALESIVRESEIFELIEPKTDITDVVLNPKIKEILEAILKQLDKDVIAKLNSWGIKKKKSIDAKLLFYGPPGTGKTLSAHSLAKSLKKEVLSFDCSKILSKWVGESEQNVRKIFDTYRQISLETKIEPVLLLNEADQFLSSRMEITTGGSEKMHNQMQNIFLEQLEKFDGVLIATTNFLESLDKAFSRRFDFKIEFKRPDYKERVILWQKVIPENANFEESFSTEKLAEYDLSGAQIAVVFKNTALKVAVREDDIFKISDFIEEIKKEQIAAFDESKKVGLL
ncbi:MAG: ATP-binding protein [Campylobacteraceae bacterium]|nr:ATP-binding protein [Campylobacteraceae bacterium]